MGSKEMAAIVRKAVRGMVPGKISVKMGTGRGCGRYLTISSEKNFTATQASALRKMGISANTCNRFAYTNPEETKEMALTYS